MKVLINIKINFLFSERYDRYNGVSFGTFDLNDDRELNYYLI